MLIHQPSYSMLNAATDGHCMVLRDALVTSALIGARAVAQPDDSLDSLKKLESMIKNKEIDGFVEDAGIDFLA